MNVFLITIVLLAPSSVGTVLKLGLMVQQPLNEMRPSILMEFGFELGIRDANLMLKPLNITLEYSARTIYGDNAEDGAKAAATFHDQGAVALFGGYDSNSCASFAGLASYFSIPTISPNGCRASKFMDPSKFPMLSLMVSGLAGFILLRDYILKIGFKTLQVIGTNDQIDLCDSLKLFLAPNNISVVASHFFAADATAETKRNAMIAAKDNGHRLIVFTGSHSVVRDVLIELDNAEMHKGFILMHFGLRLDLNIEEPTDTPERNAAALRTLRGSIAIAQDPFHTESQTFSKFLSNLKSMCNASAACTPLIAKQLDLYSISFAPSVRFYDAATGFATNIARVANATQLDARSLATAAFKSMITTSFMGAFVPYSFNRFAFTPYELLNFVDLTGTNTTRFASYTYKNGTQFADVPILYPEGWNVLPPEFELFERPQNWLEDRNNQVAIALPTCAVVAALTVAAVFLSVKARHAAKQSRQLQQRRMEDAVQANLNKRKFLRYMMHELRVPFHILDVGLQSLEDDMELFSPEIQVLLGQMGEASEMMSGLMDDALNLQRIEDGRFEIKTAPFCLEKMLTYVAHAHSIRIKTNNLKISLHVHDRARKVLVVSDEIRLRQCLSNLVDNAIKFSPSGGLIEVTCDVEDQSEVVVIAVKDQGPGVSEEDRSKLFEAWSQINSGNLQNGKGSGLGLSLVKTIMSMLQGECRIESRDNQERGALFSLRFRAPLQPVPIPIAEPAEHFHLVEQSLNDRTSPSFERTPRSFASFRFAHALSNIKILLVDDDVLSRSVTSRLLTQKGAIVTVAENGAEAVAQVRRAIAFGVPFDLVLLDNQMPVMDGSEACQLISEETRVFGLTGNAMQEDIESFRAKGALEVLTKPLKLDVLVDAIRRHGITAEIELEMLDLPPTSTVDLPELPRPPLPVTLSDEAFLPASRTQLIRPTSSPHGFTPARTDTASTPPSTCSLMTPHAPISLRVLVVDDVSTIRSVMSRLLTQRGATVKTAENGLVACEMVESAAKGPLGENFDLVLMDKEMPVMDGYEACKRISPKLPVFGVTANCLPEDIEEFKSCGALEVFKKPLKVEHLYHAIMKHNVRKMAF